MAGAVKRNGLTVEKKLQMLEALKTMSQTDIIPPATITTALKKMRKQPIGASYRTNPE